MSSADYAQLLKTLCLATVREEDKVALCVGEMFGLSFVIRGKVSKLEGTEAESTSLDGEATTVSYTHLAGRRTKQQKCCRR